MALHPRRSDMSFMDPYFDEFSLIPRIMNEMEMKTMPHHGVHPNSMTQFAPLLSADLVESETDFHIHADLPGNMILKHVTLNLDSNFLGI